MVARSEDKYILKYWHPSIAINNRYMQINLDGDRYSRKPHSDVNQIDGWYAAYHEGVFVLFKDNLDRILIGWKNHIVDVDRIEKVEWSSTIKGRHFECFGKGNNSLMTANYQTLRRFIFNPLALIGEFLIPDDDWGLVADLPSFVDSGVKDGGLRCRFDWLQQEETI